MVASARPPAPLCPEHAAIWAALSVLTDPEIPVVTLSDLGILRDVRTGDDGMAEVVITPTYSGCPAMSQIEDDIYATLTQSSLSARVITQLAPAWTTDWITPAAREKLRVYGIAPPTGHTHASIAGVVQFSRRSRTSATVACPQCGSTETTEISAFGSTACKAQYRCLSCMEPFDYFKPY